MIEMTHSPHPDAGRLVYRCGAFRVRCCACGMRATSDAEKRGFAVRDLRRDGWRYDGHRGGWRCPVCAFGGRRAG
jgi:hypothetical protein